ncbi:hypothetical protein [Sphingobium nicotianae]|uniref:Uncharacterized protein n=1 Tax=Sphingobium nicotianae TaxID=2782607 RepID=A0A9X1DAX0_9SPHN|nr:hypothetical protein [Sphingobium nicotianae]MBT2186574.1 hypothetical protein [Sphingobium nicotianae]
MSRSRRKSPIIGVTTAQSEAQCKAQAERKVRRLVRQTLGEALHGDALPQKRWALVNPWDGPKDGKHWVADPVAKWMRK